MVFQVWLSQIKADSRILLSVFKSQFIFKNQEYNSMTKSVKNGEYEYKESDFLGEGSFAKVYRGIITKTQRVIAVRLLPLKLIKQYGNKIKAIINGEVSVLKELAENPQIDCLFTTKIYDCFLTEHNVVMILEFCPDGNLEDIVSKRGPVGEQEALEIAYQLARGLQFISKRKVVHRDIKPDNIFIKKEGVHTLYKLGDFGFAVKKQINEQIVGTPIFMSPELFREEPYGSQVDVWAYGLLVHYLLFKEHYYMENSESKVKAKVLNTRYTLSQQQRSMISPLTAQFLTDCLQFDKLKRLKAESIATHPVFAGVKDKVQKMMIQVGKINEMTESGLRKETVKGQYISYIMSYHFLQELGMFLARKQNNNLATLYLFKYCYSELAALKNLVVNRVNVINHGDWGAFVQTPQYAKSFNLIDSLIANAQKAFEGYYSNVINLIAQQYPQVAQGITSNLGNGPLAQISPQIPIYELKSSWLSKLGSSSQEYLTKIEILVAIALLEKKKLDVDFYAFEMTKKTATNQEMAEMFEKALKACA